MNRCTYTRVGAYWIPELKLTEQSLHPIGKYGRMRRRYLKECVGLSNILDREGRENLSGSSPMKRTHGTGVAPTLGGS